ncbi:MAG: ankyrin repeat domain-containing protein [Chloroflexi bacterium]|nr:ankyrin repeat domain-containing protein [Chloroflexota bacterium]
MVDALHIHEAFKQGDLEVLLIVLDEPPARLILPDSEAFGHCLEYAVYHSPISLIKQLLDLGADPNYPDHAGFPSLIATLTTDRPDKNQIIELLIAAGADIQQNGINGFTPLHQAASNNDVSAAELLLAHGANPNARTDVDEFTTPLEEAESSGHVAVAEILRKVTDTLH